MIFIWFVLVQGDMWGETPKRSLTEDSDLENDSNGEEILIWVQGEQRYISGVSTDTTCNDIITVLLDDEKNRVST